MSNQKPKKLYNNWDNAYQKNFNPNTKTNINFSEYSVPTDPDKIGNIVRGDKPESIAISELPRHQFVPPYADSIDIRNAAIIPPGGNYEILRFTAPQGAVTFFYGYALFNDALLFANTEFIPRVDGARVLRYHGYEVAPGNFKLSLGVSADVSNAALVVCSLQLEPGQVLTWNAINNDVVNVTMAVRQAGYLDSTSRRVAARKNG